MGLKFDKEPLVFEQNNYTIKIVNACIVYETDVQTKIPYNNFKSKDFLFGATNTEKSGDKAKWFYSDYGKAFDGAGSWNFDKYFAENVVTFGVDNRSSSLVLGEEPTNSSSRFA